VAKKYQVRDCQVPRSSGNFRTRDFYDFFGFIDRYRRSGEFVPLAFLMAFNYLCFDFHEKDSGRHISISVSLHFDGCYYPFALLHGKADFLGSVQS
jgi:hypothetical protein